MYDKVVILEIASDYALAMSRSGEVLRICLKDGLEVGQQVYITEEDRYQKSAAKAPVPLKARSKPKKMPWLTGVLVAAMALLVVGVATVASNWNQENEILGLGRNPSIQLEINNKGSIQALTDASGKEQAGAKYIGEELKDEIDQLLGQVKVADDQNMVVASTGLPKDQADQVRQQIRDYYEANGYDGDLIFLQAENSEYQAAKDKGQSLADYLIDHYGLNIWTREESRDLSDQEKKDRLKGHGDYIHVVNEDQRKKEEEEAKRKEEKKKEEEEKKKEEAKKEENSGDKDDQGANPRPSSQPEARPNQPAQRPQQPAAPSAPAPAPQPAPYRAPAPAPQPSYDDDWDDDDWDDDDWDDDDD
ncbi:anti-sigma factor domain-containing protein [Aerococcus sp. UMB7834]|uniref:anti-sigma factor domain-containing protein n=1 Tax=Aerococcus sp. UMB7834 TaxID=3046342 RepID=UPI00254AEFA3|nr:anti-sigma factor domain-containing protein [Aerococcus sp. UMB7834]MDK6804667.1 anti-sigma factor domain-containing protein [Aerococcus sp. UMB7834]